MKSSPLLRPVATVLGVVAVLLLGACQQHGEAAPQQQQRIERSINVGGITRSYVAHLPDNPDSSRRWPVVVAFHPALSSATRMEERSRFHETPLGQRVVIVYPDGYRRTWNDGECCGNAAEENIDDIAFYRALLDDLNSVVPIEDKAYIAGWSNGARMVYRLVCSAPDRVKAAAAFGATFRLNPGTCPMPSAVPLFHLHGREDQQSPIGGGKPQGFLSRFASRVGDAPPAIDSVRYVAQRNGCQAQDEISLLQTNCLRFSQCRNDATVLYCPIPGLGHIWPGAQARMRGSMFGPARPDLPASNTIIDFFLRHR